MTTKETKTQANASATARVGQEAEGVCERGSGADRACWKQYDRSGEIPRHFGEVFICFEIMALDMFSTDHALDRRCMLLLRPWVATWIGCAPVGRWGRLLGTGEQADSLRE